MEREELTDKAIDYIVSEMNTDHLTTWETSFFESVSDQWKRRRSLSEKQKETLGNIWDKQP